MDVDDLDAPVTKGAVAGFLLLVLVAGGVFALYRYVLSDGNSDTVSATASTITTITQPEPDPEASSTTATTVLETETTSTTVGATSTTEYVPVFATQEASGLFDPEDPTRRAVLKAGVVYLGGEIRSAIDADTIATKVAGVVGPDNVYVEYRINPDAPLSNEGILEVADLVLFDSNKATLRPEFVPLLDLGVALLTANPDVTIHVVAHTDTKGPAAENLALSQERADAITGYWTAAGIDPSRVSGEGKGETEPIADEIEPGGAQLNRRAEFIIRGLLG